METSQIVTSNSSFAEPQIMSEVSIGIGKELRDYAYNVTADEQYVATYNHTFIQHCQAVRYVWPTYYGYGCAWALITILFTTVLYCMPESERFSLQKSLIMLPVLKCAEVFLEGGYLSFCPFYSLTSNGVQYTQMARISVITITYTVFLSFLYLICKGWQTTISQLTRNQATNLTMIMGGVYLTYSAYFLSEDFIYIYYTMNALMVGVYGGLAYTFGINCYENIKTCNSYINEMVDGEPNIMSESLVLKRRMLM
jgi:hypothetical protein